MIPCLCFLRMALTYIVPVRYCMNRGSANGASAGGAFLVDISTEAVAEVRGPDELRLLIFPQPLDGALKNQNAAPASPPCFRRRRWSAPLLFESCTVHHTVRTRTRFFTKKGSGTFFVYRRFCERTTRNGKRAKAGYHRGDGILPFVLRDQGRFVRT